MINRIRELREEKGMTQAQLCIYLDVAQETISAYETGKHFPSVKSLLKIIELFDVSLDYIIGLSSIRKIMISSEYLTSEETEILNLYRKMDFIEREKVISYIQGMTTILKDIKSK